MNALSALQSIRAKILSKTSEEASVSSLLKESLNLFKFPYQKSDPELTKILWLIKLRWMAVFLFFTMAIPNLLFDYLEKSNLPIYIGIISTVFLFNLFMQLIWNHRKTSAEPYMIGLHLTFDLTALSLLLLTSGGFENPFIVLFLLNASLGAILLPGSLGWPFLVLTHAFLALLQMYYLFNHAFDLQTFVIICISHLLIFSFWVVMHALGGYLAKQHQWNAQARLAAEKQDRLRALGALTAGFSHEFASPLNTAKIRIERMARLTPQNEDMVEALTAIRSCEQVIHQMNSSQMDTRDFKNKTVGALDFVQDIVDTWKEQHPEVEVQLKIEKSDYVTVPLLTFAQVILNLLDNATEAAPDKPITIQHQLRHGLHILVFEDQGTGFPALVLEKFGEPFITTKAHGTGLGLYTSQLFAQSLGGDLIIQNHESGGRVILQWPSVKGAI